MSKVFQIVTDQIVKAIENDNLLPWCKPWNASNTSCKNYKGNEYRGINIFLTLLSGRPGPWITLKQAHAVGGRIKDSEFKKSQMITFYTTFNKTDAHGDVDRIPVFRYYSVWSLEQTENVPLPAWLAKEQKERAEHPVDTINAAEGLWEGYKGKPDVTSGGDRACYSPWNDKITMPIRDSFKDSGHFYSVLFHEGVHSTGHKSRLARKDFNQPTPFGSEDYSKEELIAEMGAAMLCALVGIENTINTSAAYVKHWLSKLTADPKLIVQAASQAQKACDHIRGTTFDNAD